MPVRKNEIRLRLPVVALDLDVLRRDLHRCEDDFSAAKRPCGLELSACIKQVVSKREHLVVLNDLVSATDHTQDRAVRVADIRHLVWDDNVRALKGHWLRLDHPVQTCCRLHLLGIEQFLDARA